MKSRLKLWSVVAVCYWAMYQIENKIFFFLFFFFYSKFPPCIGAQTVTPALSEELIAASLVPMDAVLLQLLPLRSFVESVLQKELREFRS